MPKKVKKSETPEKQKAVKTPSAPEPQPLEDEFRKLKCWETFFRCQRNPVLRSQLLTSLMAGNVLEVEHLTAVTVFDVLLLATAARRFNDAEIVNDYGALLIRAREIFEMPTYNRAVADQQHLGLVDFAVIWQGEINFLAYEDQYIPDMVRWYLNHDAPQYIELETK